MVSGFVQGKHSKRRRLRSWKSLAIILAPWVLGGVVRWFSRRASLEIITMGVALNHEGPKGSVTLAWLYQDLLRSLRFSVNTEVNF